MEKWTLPDSYWGDTYYDYYVLLGRSRDSSILEESNFAQALEMLGGEQDDKVIVVRASHWAVGWVEFIGIHEDAQEEIAIGEDIEKRLANYPILNEDDFGQREWDSARDFWNSTREKERKEILAHCGMKTRLRNFERLMRANDSGRLYDYLRQD